MQESAKAVAKVCAKPHLCFMVQFAGTDPSRHTTLLLLLGLSNVSVQACTMASRESKSDAASSSAVDSGKPDAASRIAHATKTLRTVTDHCPTISRAWLGAAGVDGQRSIMVQRSFQDVEANVVRKFVTTHALVEGTGWVNASLFPMQAADTVRMSPSPSGRRLAVIRSSTPKKGGKDKYFLDVLDAGTLLTTVELTSHHDKVVGDNWFGALSWSSDESQVVYVALPKPETRSSFWDTDKKAKNRGTDFDFQEDWFVGYCQCAGSSGVSQCSAAVCVVVLAGARATSVCRPPSCSCATGRPGKWRP